jgi:hypothetical protein
LAESRHSITLQLTERQVESLKDAVDSWLEGYEEATNQVMLDPSLTGPTDMLDAMDSIRNEFRDFVDIRQQLWMFLQSLERRN